MTRVIAFFRIFHERSQQDGLSRAKGIPVLSTLWSFAMITLTLVFGGALRVPRRSFRVISDRQPVSLLPGVAGVQAPLKSLAARQAGPAAAGNDGPQDAERENPARLAASA